MAVWSFTSDYSLIAAKYQCESVYMFTLTCVRRKRKKMCSIERALNQFSLFPFHSFKLFRETK